MSKAMSMWNYEDVDSKPILDGFPWRFGSDSLRSECEPYWINVVKSFGSQSSFSLIYIIYGEAPLCPDQQRRVHRYLCAWLIVDCLFTSDSYTHTHQGVWCVSLGVFWSHSVFATSLSAIIVCFFVKATVQSVTS
jgi:hypothetical protein